MNNAINTNNTMDRQHFADTSEENKENLPRWLIEQSAPLWARLREAAAARSAASTTPLRPRTRSPDEDLVERLSTISFYGRGGHPPRSSTAPAARPRVRARIPEAFGGAFVIHCDEEETQVEEGEKTPEVFLPERVMRGGRARAASYPGMGERRGEGVMRVPFEVLEMGVVERRRVVSAGVRPVGSDTIEHDENAGPSHAGSREGATLPGQLTLSIPPRRPLGELPIITEMDSPGPSNR